jgi:rod shape-determining protein MreD
VSVALGLLLIIIAALAQVSILPAFSIFGAQPNLIVIILVVWIAVRGQREAVFLIPAAGIVLGLLDSQLLGVAMLALAPLILVAALHDARLVQSDLLFAVLVVGVATLVYEGTLLLTLTVTGERPDWLANMLDAFLPAIIANVLLLLPMYLVIRLLSREPPRRPAFLA